MSSARAFQSGNIFCESEATHNTLVTVTESEADTVRTQDDPPISEDSSKRDTIVDSEAMLSDMPIGSPEASSGSIQMDDSREDAVEVELGDVEAEGGTAVDGANDADRVTNPSVAPAR